jgi:hypothetical protein
MTPLSRITLARMLGVAPATITIILARHGWGPQKHREKNEALTKKQVLCVLEHFYRVEKDRATKKKLLDTHAQS